MMDRAAVRSWALAVAVVAIGAIGSSSSALSAAVEKAHALSLVAKPAYGPEFKHFGWVNPDAPKGGELTLDARGSFDSLNDHSVRGLAARGLALISDNLMMQSPDEPATQYCFVCEWVSHPADYSSVTFKIRAEARFHDGTPITPEDIIYSMEGLKKAHPQYAFYYKNVVKGEKTGDREVTFTFDIKGNRELPVIVGDLEVLPRHYWTGNDANGTPRDLARSSLEVPLGSGPYRVGKVVAGRSITFERVKDWWAKDLPAARGQWNFETVTFEYFRETTSAFETFKSGAIDYWAETSAKEWATSFVFPAVRDGLVKKEQIPVERVAAMQGFVFNTRREKLQDPRLRRAFNLAFDFEWMNKNLFFEQYARVNSYFDNSELAATGLPQGRELELLKSLGDAVPPEAFTTEWKNPVARTPQELRDNLRRASQLLTEAGWKTTRGGRVNAKGEVLSVEFLLVQPAFERVALAYKEQLNRLGIAVDVRTVDTSQYKRRRDTFDFDIIVDSFPQSFSPGNEQRDFFGSQAAEREGSRNTIGIKSKAVDTLIDAIISSKDRADLVAATRALDRVLLWNHYVVPQWHAPFERIAYWDRYSRPARLPRLGSRFMQVWWLDQAKADALASRRRGQ